MVKTRSAKQRKAQQAKTKVMAETHSARRRKTQQNKTSMAASPKEHVRPTLTSLPPEVLCNIVEHVIESFSLTASWDARKRSWHMQLCLPDLNLMLGHRRLRDAAEVVRARRYNGIMRISFTPESEPDMWTARKERFWKDKSSPKGLPNWPYHLDWIRWKTNTIEWYFPKGHLEVMVQKEITPVSAELGQGVKITIDFQHYHGTYMWLRHSDPYVDRVKEVLSGKREAEIAVMARKQLQKPMNRMIAEFLLPEVYVSSKGMKCTRDTAVPVVDDVEYVWKQQSSFEYNDGLPDREGRRWPNGSEGGDWVFVAATSFDSQQHKYKAVFRRRWDGKRADAKLKIEIFDTTCNNPVS